MASTAQYSDRVIEVLDHIEKRSPINVASQKMFYVPTKQLDPGRLPQVIEGLTQDDIFAERTKAEGRINTAPTTKEEEHMADVTAAMLFLGCGGMDEAHNIVLPYSWPSDTHFGGPAVKDSPAAKESEYCHALIHRKEGDVIGELGAQGFWNCKFWFGRTGFHPLYETVKIEALKMAEGADISDNTVKSFVKDLSSGQSWHPDAFSDLCAYALESKEQQVVDFCNRLSATEWKLLMNHCNSVVNPLSD